MDLSQLSKDELIMLFVKSADRSLMSTSELNKEFKLLKNMIIEKKIAQVKEYILNNVSEEFKETVAKMTCIRNSGGHLSLVFPGCRILFKEIYVYLLEKDYDIPFDYLVCWDTRRLETSFNPGYSEPIHKEYFELGKYLGAKMKFPLSRMFRYTYELEVLHESFDPHEI